MTHRQGVERSNTRIWRRTTLFSCAVALSLLASRPKASEKSEDLLVMTGETGSPGGTLVIALRSEPRTFNPVLSVDTTSRQVIAAMNGDLIHINRESQRTEPALAKSWTVSPDGRKYTLRLRQGVRFSDGVALDADDVVFSFEAYLDPELHSSQRDQLLIGGKPITVRKVDSSTVQFELANPYAAAERLFDGFAILPAHLLLKPYREGKLGQLLGNNASPNQLVGLGPFRFKEYIPGQKLVLERNPYYWKSDAKGNRLPYLAELVFLFVSNDDAQVLRFESSETQLLERIRADNFAVLQRDRKPENACLMDLGSALEYVFLFFNLNSLDAGRYPEITRKQAWFRDLNFRQAVSLAADREGIARLVYNGRSTPIWSQVTPGNRLWVNSEIPRPRRSVEVARGLLAHSGFSWTSEGDLVDPQRHLVEFTILTSSSNAQRLKISTILADDLKQLGMKVQIVPLEFRAFVDRLLNSKDYEAAVAANASGDADPTAEMNVWLSRGAQHLWDLGEAKPAAAWEAEMDQLMEKQLTTVDYAERKRLYDRVQSLVAENLPIICLVSPNVLVGASGNLGNFRPAVLEPYTLWNAEQLFFRREGARACR